MTLEELESENRRLNDLLDSIYGDLNLIIEEEDTATFGMFGTAPRIMIRMVVSAMKAKMSIDKHRNSNAR